MKNKNVIKITADIFGINVYSWCLKFDELKKVFYITDAKITNKSVEWIFNAVIQDVVNEVQNPAYTKFTPFKKEV